jgi:hypothetical protein
LIEQLWNVIFIWHCVLYGRVPGGSFVGLQVVPGGVPVPQFVMPFGVLSLLRVCA